MLGVSCAICGEQLSASRRLKAADLAVVVNRTGSSESESSPLERQDFAVGPVRCMPPKFWIGTRERLSLLKHI